MTTQWLRTDEKEDLISSLKMIDVAVRSLPADEQMWKWVVISTHAAVQGMFVVRLESGDSFEVSKPKGVEKWLAAHRGDRNYPELKMDYFTELYGKVKSGKVQGFNFQPNSTRDENITRLNSLRNDFIHFMPKGWSIEIALLCEVCLDCLNMVQSIGATLETRWDNDEQADRFERMCRNAIANLAEEGRRHGVA